MDESLVKIYNVIHITLNILYIMNDLQEIWNYILNMDQFGLMNLVLWISRHWKLFAEALDFRSQGFNFLSELFVSEFFEIY